MHVDRQLRQSEMTDFDSDISVLACDRISSILSRLRYGQNELSLGKFEYAH